MFFYNLLKLSLLPDMSFTLCIILQCIPRFLQANDYFSSNSSFAGFTFIISLKTAYFVCLTGVHVFPSFDYELLDWKDYTSRSPSLLPFLSSFLFLLFFVFSLPSFTSSSFTQFFVLPSFI